MSTGLRDAHEAAGQGVLAGMPERLYSASPSRLYAWLDCPRRYRMAYLDRPRPPVRAQRAHTSIGTSVHSALRDFWDLPAARQRPESGAELVRRSWVATGFRDHAQSEAWLQRTSAQVTAYLQGVDPRERPVGIERTLAMRTATLTVSGRVDRLDDRAGGLVVVDYKTSRRPSSTEDARTSLQLALYAVGAARTLRRPCWDVELHHVPTGTVARHRHTPESLRRKVAEAESIAADLRRADADFAARGADSESFPARPSPMCRWCDVRSHCPQGQLVGPEHPGWAALDDGRPEVGG